MNIAAWRAGLCLVLSGMFCKPAYADIFVCAIDSVQVFADSAIATDPPIRTIAGSNAGITECYDLALDIKHDELYVADGPEIKIFQAGASGNVAPIRRIGDSALFMCSVAVDFQTDEVFAGSIGPTLVKFARTASGPTTPLLSKTLTGADTPISIFVNRFHNEIAASGNSNGNVYFFDPGTFNATAHPTLNVAMAKGLFASSADDELFIAIPGGVQVYAWNGNPTRVIGTLPTSAWGIGITASSALWVTYKGSSVSDPDHMIVYSSTGPTQVLSQINTAAPLSKEAHGIAVSGAAGCGAGHVACDSLFWESFETRRK